jgi:CheY-like chemotaxis protein
MATISVIDDDKFLSDYLAAELTSRGHDVRVFQSAATVLEEADAVAASDVVVLDVMMPVPSGMSAALAEGGLRTGGVVARELLTRRPSLRLVFLSNAPADRLEPLLAVPQRANVLLLSKAEWPAPRCADRIELLLRQPDHRPPPRAFIVHGHDEATKLALKNYVQNTLGWPEPIVLHERPSQGRAIIEKFERYAAEAQVVFVLLTPDDSAADPASGNAVKRRARQNVIFEMGYFLGALGRRSGRVLLLHKGPLDLPSDIAGVVYVDISGGVEAAGEVIRREVAHVYE